MLLLSWCFSLLSGLLKTPLASIRACHDTCLEKKLPENIFLSKYSILQKYKVFHGSVLVSMTISQGKLLRAQLEFLGKKEKRERLPGKSCEHLGHRWPHILSSLGAEMIYSARLPIYLPLPLSLSLVRGVLLCEWFTILWSKVLLCRPVVRFLVSTIGDRGQSPGRDKGRAKNLNSAFPLVSKQVGHLAISSSAVDMSKCPSYTFSLLKTFLFDTGMKVSSATGLSPCLWNKTVIFLTLLLKYIVHQVKPKWNRL